MHRFKVFGRLSLPSMASTFGVLAVSLALLFLINSTQIMHITPLYGHLFGPDGQVTALQTKYIQTPNFMPSLFSKLITYLLVAAAVIALVGGVVYEILLANNPQTHELARRITQSLGIATWVVYSVLWLGVLAPMLIFSLQTGQARLFTASGWPYLLSAFMLLILSIHLHVVCMRLAMRQRIFDDEM